MARFLSPEWMEEMNAALASRDAAAGDAHLVLQQVVTGGPDGDVAYALEIEGGGVRLTAGRSPTPDVTITEDYGTAAAIHRGELTLQDAFMAGRVKVAGNLATLVANQAALAALDVDLPAPMRERDEQRRLAHGPRAWILVGAVVVVIVGLAWLTLPRDHPGPKVLTDSAFISTANQQCKATISGLRPVITPNSTVPPAQIAADVDRVADGLAGLAGKLRALPAATADQPHITRWLDGWTEYTDIGHRYAAALRADDLKTQIALNQSGNSVQKATDRFARANDLDDCQFFIKPRGTGSDPFSGGM